MKMLDASQKISVSEVSDLIAKNAKSIKSEILALKEHLIAEVNDL